MLTTTAMAIWSPVLRVMAVSVSPEAPAVSGFCGAGLSLGEPPGSLPFGGEDVAMAVNVDETVSLEEGTVVDTGAWARLVDEMARRVMKMMVKRDARSVNIVNPSQFDPNQEKIENTF